MHFFENIEDTQYHIGLCSLHLKNDKINSIYKNKYNPLLFKKDLTLPVKDAFYLIDQILCHP